MENSLSGFFFIVHFAFSLPCIQDESDCFVRAQQGLDVMHDRLGRAIKQARQSRSSASSNGIPAVQIQADHRPHTQKKSSPVKSTKGGSGSGIGSSYRDYEEDGIAEVEEEEEDYDDGDSDYEERAVNAAKKRRRAGRPSPKRGGPKGGKGGEVDSGDGWDSDGPTQHQPHVKRKRR